MTVIIVTGSTRVRPDLLGHALELSLEHPRGSAIAEAASLIGAKCADVSAAELIR